MKKIIVALPLALILISTHMYAATTINSSVDHVVVVLTDPSRFVFESFGLKKDANLGQNRTAFDFPGMVNIRVYYPVNDDTKQVKEVVSKKLTITVPDQKPGISVNTLLPQPAKIVVHKNAHGKIELEINGRRSAIMA